MDDLELELKKDFIDEALLNLEEAENAFMELEGSPNPIPLLEQIFRLAHNLKGGSRAVGFGDVAEFTHELENLVLKIQKSEVNLTSEMVTTLLKSNDRLVEMLTQLKSDMNAQFQNGDLIAELKAWIEGRVSEAPKIETIVEDSVPEEVVKSEIEVPVASEVELTPEASAFFSGDDLAEIIAMAQKSEAPKAKVEIPKTEAPQPKLKAVPSPTPPPPAQNSQTGEKSKSNEKEDEVVRVNLSRIDLLNDLVGELIVTQSMVQQQSMSGNPLKLQAAIQQMTKLSKDIQSIAMGLRMLPIKPLVQKLQRVVRDTAKLLGKDVVLELEGEQLDVDKSVLDRLADPLIHMLRNAVDHGLEMPEERVQAKKPPQGCVKLGFSNEGNYLTIFIKDDGKGIDPERLKSKAIDKGIISASQSYTEKQLLHLIFNAGFSMKEQTSEISGRGVGMDVVKTNIEKIGGQVDLQTVLGEGTRFDIKIPLSLAVIEGLVVKTSAGRYVVPLNQVQETINLESLHIHRNKLGMGDCIELRSCVVPLLTMDSVMGASKSKDLDATQGIALVFEVGGQLIALAVQEVLRSQQVVIKPLGNGIKGQKGWVGTCVLGDGLPTLILSPNDLLENKITQRRAA